MRKQLQKVIRQAIKQSFLDYTLLVLKSIGYIAVFLLVIRNVTMSQNISPSYFQIVNQNRKGEIDFLQRIQTLPEYEKYLDLGRKLYGEDMEKEVNRDALKRKAEISHLESILRLNPQARDVLYGLSKFYRVQGDVVKADIYLEKAKEVDPTIKE